MARRCRRAAFVLLRAFTNDRLLISDLTRKRLFNDFDTVTTYAFNVAVSKGCQCDSRCVRKKYLIEPKLPW